MCGICGVVNLHGQQVDEVVGRRMMDLLWHRGPDGEGVFVGQSPTGSRRPSVFLGHRRLKIIDLSDAARQPLPNEDGTVWVIFNGEIYNFRELRETLKQRGHVFRSRSDTETIVHAYEEFGACFVQRLDGMFAFALWDERKGALTVARDRSGKKPLFYVFDGERFTFASEIKALLACPWVERRVAPEHIPEYLTFGYVPTPRTLYRGIYQVPPACYAVVDRTGVGGPDRYWKLSYSGYPQKTASRMGPAATHVRELLTDAVSRRLISDVPLGAFLSGGLDSSIVVGIMSHLTKQPVRTFTIGFTDDASYDERPYAAIAARHYGTEHTELVAGNDILPLAERLVWHHDQPFGDISAIPTYLVSRLARQYVTVALNGDGGDEVFAGYERFLAALLAQRLPQAFTPFGRAAARWLPDGHGYYSFQRRLRRFFAEADAPGERRFMGWISIFSTAALAGLLRSDFNADLSDASLYRSVDQWHRETEGLPLLHQLLYLNFMTYLPDDLHVKMDRMSMANSLETRSPILDTALVEFAASLAPDAKVHRGRLKYVLRMAFHDMVPPALLKRKKHGFGVPVGHWFRHQLRPIVDEVLLSPQARLRDYLEQGAVRTLFQDHLRGRVDHGHRLWVLLTFELWLRMLQTGALWQPQRPPHDACVGIGEAQRT